MLQGIWAHHTLGRRPLAETHSTVLLSPVQWCLQSPLVNSLITPALNFTCHLHYALCGSYMYPVCFRLFMGTLQLLTLNPKCYTIQTEMIIISPTASPDEPVIDISKCPSGGLCKKLPADCVTCSYQEYKLSNCTYGRTAAFLCKPNKGVHCTVSFVWKFNSSWTSLCVCVQVFPQCFIVSELLIHLVEISWIVKYGKPHIKTNRRT